MKRQSPLTGNAEIGSAGHRELVEHVGVCVRKLGGQSVIASRTIADKFGLHTTDLEVLDHIFLRERVPAGELAVATGLSTGSVTALIDRLVAAGYVERRPDPTDRRRVLVEVRPEAIAPIKAVYENMSKQMLSLWEQYSSRDLTAIADFLSRSTELHLECVKQIHSSSQARPRSRNPRRQKAQGG